MRSLSTDPESTSRSAFIESLSSFSKLHRAQRWEGTFGEFLADILPASPAAMARTSHEYIWDMLRWHGRTAQPDAAESARARELFKRELFGIDEPLSRVVDYFKAAAAGADWNKTFYQVLTDQPGKDAWPITGATFIMMHKLQNKPAQAAAVLKFFDWAYKDGDKMAADLEYVTLPDSVKALVRKQWGEIKDAGGKLAYATK